MKMQIVRAKFLRGGVPSGRAYAYRVPDDGEEYMIGDYIYLREDAIGVIDEIDVRPADIGFPIEDLKTFIGRASNPEVQIPEAEEGENNG